MQNIIKKALVIGLNDYPDGNGLNFCSNDANDISSLLSSNGDGTGNFHVRKIIDNCHANDMLEAIRELFNDDADVALLYYSGHGENLLGGMLVGTDLQYVSMLEIINLANTSRCKNKIIILDCCYSANLGQDIMSKQVAVLGNGVTIMTASQHWQPSIESYKLQHGLFTNLLIQGLKGRAADLGGNITPASLYAFIDQSLGGWDPRPVFKTNSSQFLPLRIINPKVPRIVLHKITEFFPSEESLFQLDPSFEFTNKLDVNHEVIEPYANEINVDRFKTLQKYESIGLVEPVDEEHMYFAAMHSKACRLTELGKHFWELAKDNKI